MSKASSETEDFQRSLARVEVMLDGGDVGGARTLAEDMVSTYGRVPALLHVLGVVAAHEGRVTEAARLFQEVLRREPTLTVAGLSLAIMMGDLGEMERAEGLVGRVEVIAEKLGQEEMLEAIARVRARWAAGEVGEGDEGDEAAGGVLADFAQHGVVEMGVEAAGEDWFPWLRTASGLKIYNLSLATFAALKPGVDEPSLVRLAWNHNLWDLRFRHRAETRPQPVHLNHVVEPGQTIVELGAYLGHYTLRAAEAVGPSGRVVAVEFMPDNFEVLRRNLAANFPDRAVAVHCGVWSSAGVRSAHRKMLQANSFVDGVLTGETDTVEVPTQTVAGLMAQQGVERADLVIATVNGAELEVLKGAEGVLDRIDAWAVAARYDAGGAKRVDEVSGWLSARGYVCEVVGGDHVYARRPG